MIITLLCSPNKSALPSIISTFIILNSGTPNGSPALFFPHPRPGSKAPSTGPLVCTHECWRHSQKLKSMYAACPKEVKVEGASVRTSACPLVLQVFPTYVTFDTFEVKKEINQRLRRRLSHTQVPQLAQQNVPCVKNLFRHTSTEDRKSAKWLLRILFAAEEN